MTPPPFASYYDMSVLPWLFFISKHPVLISPSSETTVIFFFFFKSQNKCKQHASNTLIYFKQHSHRHRRAIQHNTHWGRCFKPCHHFFQLKCTCINILWANKGTGIMARKHKPRPASAEVLNQGFTPWACPALAWSWQRVSITNKHNFKVSSHHNYSAA